MPDLYVCGFTRTVNRSDGRMRVCSWLQTVSCTRFNVCMAFGMNECFWHVCVFVCLFVCLFVFVKGTKYDVSSQ